MDKILKILNNITKDILNINQKIDINSTENNKILTKLNKIENRLVRMETRIKKIK